MTTKIQELDKLWIEPEYMDADTVIHKYMESYLTDELAAYLRDNPDIKEVTF